MDLAVIPGKSDILEVTGFITVSDKKMLIRFSSEITEEHFSVHPPSVRVIPPYVYVKGSLWCREQCTGGTINRRRGKEGEAKCK